MTMSSVLIPFFVVLMAGFACRFIPSIPKAEDLRKSINTIVIWFFLPALLFQILGQNHPDSSYLFVPVVALGTLFLNILTAWGLSWCMTGLFPLPAPTRGAMIIVASWGNITFIGLPLLGNLYGPSASKIAILYDILALGPSIFILGPVIGGFFNNETATTGRFLKSLKKGISIFLKLPPFWGAALGILYSFTGQTIPETMNKSLDLMGRGVTPLMLFSVGLTLNLPKSRSDILAGGPLIVTAFLKLILSPLISTLLMNITLQYLLPQTNMTPIQLSAMTLEAAMPSMVASLIVAEIAHLDLKFTAQAITLTTILSLLTLPFVQHTLIKF